MKKGDITRVFYLAIFFALKLNTLAVSQSNAALNADDDGKLISDAFATARSGVPELAWQMPNGEFVTEVDSRQITIIAAGVGTKIAPQNAVIAADEVRKFVARNKVDCDQVDEDKPVPLYRYATRIPATKEAQQVFVTKGGPISGIKEGHEEFKPSDAQMSRVWQSMGKKEGQRSHARSVRQPNASLFFTFALTYQRDGNLQRKGIFLQDATGNILGNVIENVDGKQDCDGCGVPTYRDGIDAVFRVLNLVSIPQLTYPMLLEDSSTVEGRAIALFTFSTKGTPSTYRKYEYMTTCVLGPDPNVTPRTH